MPVSRLKNVVLPAPFGPISATISPSSTWKSMSARAFSPPNRIVTFLASRIDISYHLQARRGYLGALFFEEELVLRMELAGTAGRWQEPLWPPSHHDDHEQAEHQVAVVADGVRLVGGEEPGEQLALAEVPDDLRQAGDDDRAKGRSRDRAHAAEHDHAHDEHRLEEVERLGTDEADPVAVR